MSRGTEFLEYVTGQLEQRIRELDETIQEVQKDISEMNEYYWENYAEMDSTDMRILITSRLFLRRSTQARSIRSSVIDGRRCWIHLSLEVWILYMTMMRKQRASISELGILRGREGACR